MISFTDYLLPSWFIRGQVANISLFAALPCLSLAMIQFDSYSSHYCFWPYKLPLASLVIRSVIAERHCMIRLPQFNALPVCLALNRLNKFNNVFHQFSKINAARFPLQRDYYLKCWELIFRRGKMPSGRGWGGLSVG